MRVRRRLEGKCVMCVMRHWQFVVEPTAVRSAFARRDPSELFKAAVILRWSVVPNLGVRICSPSLATCNTVVRSFPARNFPMSSSHASAS